MPERAVSTVVDVSLCLLLVSAGAVLLAGVGGPVREDAPPADRSGATLVGSVPLTVESAENRTVRGTAATLLADAAVVRFRGNESRALPAVREAVGRLLGRLDPAAAVTATYRGSQVRVGARPPPGASVDAATLRVPVAAGGNATVVVRTWSP